MGNEFPFEHFLQSNPQSNLANNVNKIEGLEDKFLKIPTNNSHSELNNSEGFSKEELSFMRESILKTLKSTIPESKYQTYFYENFVLQDILGTTATFTVTTDFIKGIIESTYLEQVKDAIIKTLGKPYTVTILVSNSEFNNMAAQPPQIPQQRRTAKDTTFTIDLNSTDDELLSKVESKYINHMDTNSHSILIDPNKTFDNFIVGPSNQLAFATAIAVSDTPGKPGKYPCLYIHSDSGLGKTHLLHSVANGIKEKCPELVITLITAREFMKEMINAIQIKKLPEFQKKYSETIDVLMIDDIHELKNKQGTQNEFFHIFNALHNKGKQLIFTSDKAPSEIDGIEERVKTRLQWGLVIDIQKPDLETRIAILKRKANELDLFITDEVFNLIACSIKSNIRELEGSLIKLSAFADVMNVEIDSEMAKDLLKLNPTEDSKEITLEIIAKATSQYFKIPLADLKSKARGKEIVKARHLAMYLSKKILDATLKDIARFYGGRDHSSVIHGVNKITEQLKTERVVSRDVIYIENNL